MLEDCKTARERWGGVHSIIDRWLEERQQLLVLYCAVTGVHESHTQPLTAAISEFIDILVDYVSAGHFEVYQQLIKEGEEFDDQVAVELGHATIAKIQDSTDMALGFQDRFLVCPNIYEFCSWMERMGPVLETRFELEDQLIESLHSIHRNAL